MKLKFDRGARGHAHDLTAASWLGDDDLEPSWTPCASAPSPSGGERTRADVHHHTTIRPRLRDDRNDGELASAATTVCWDPTAHLAGVLLVHELTHSYFDQRGTRARAFAENAYLQQLPRS